MIDTPTPTLSGLPHRAADFATVQEALAYAARGETGMNFYSGRGALVEVLPYRALHDHAVDRAHRLLGAGLVPGDRVALIAETDADFVRAFCACLYAGVVPVPLPLPTGLGSRDAYVAGLRQMIGGAGAVAAFAAPAFEAWLGGAVAGMAMKATGTTAAIADLPRAETALPPPDVAQLCYIQFSSGSTRAPLGVSVTQRALMANAHAISAYGLATRPGDRCVSWLPLYHDMGLVGFMLAPMLSQLSVDYLATREFARRPLLWLDLIARNGGTLSYSPSFGYELCARRAETASIGHLDLRGWRVAGIGGDMIRPGVLRSFAAAFAPAGFDARAFLASYGMAEATLALSFAPLDQGIGSEVLDMDRLEAEGDAVAAPAGAPRSREFVRCGGALPGHALEIRDPAGVVLGERRVGRIFARGPSLMQAYFERPDETGAAMSPAGWLDTGDLGYMAGGEVVITGRAKDLILVNGRNVWPQDLEWTAETEIPGLRTGDAVAFSIDSVEGEQVVMLVQSRVAEAEARGRLVGEVINLIRARHGVEVQAMLVEPRSLPQTSSGKLSRARAREMFRRGAFAGQAAPRAAE